MLGVELFNFMYKVSYGLVMTMHYKRFLVLLVYSTSYYLKKIGVTCLSL